MRQSSQAAVIVNHRHKFVFYHVPKAAGTSIRTALAGIPGSKRPSGTKHWTPREYEARAGWLQRLRIRNYFTFCFVRDPVERFGSAHQFNVHKGTGILPDDPDLAAQMLKNRVEAAVTLRSLLPQVDYARGLDFVGRFETLEEDFAAVTRRIGVDMELPALNSSGNSEPYRRLFTRETIAILTDYYAEDIAAFGYDRRDAGQDLGSAHVAG